MQVERSVRSDDLCRAAADAQRLGPPLGRRHIAQFVVFHGGSITARRDVPSCSNRPVDRIQDDQAMRIDLYKAWPDGLRTLNELDKALELSLDATVSEHLLELVKLRVSQINGCAFCLVIHSKRLRRLGENQTRLDVLSAWREANVFTIVETAAFELAEALTLVASGEISDEVIESARMVFTDEQISKLAFAIVSINGWNRLSITMKRDIRVHHSH